MTITRMLAALAAGAATLLLFAAPASAQATRTWVSGVGDDVNPCSRTAPCQTFAGAISKTAAGGEIDCLDPGGMGQVTITKSITIDCTATGGVGGLSAPGGNGINITGGTQVELIGLDINGMATGVNGVNVTASNVNVAIINSVIHGFQTAGANSGAGVTVTGSGSKLYVQSSIFRNNNAAVNVAPTSGAATVELDHAMLDNNSTGAAGLSGNLIVGAGGMAILNASTLTSASPGVSNAGTVISYGNNMIRGGVTGAAITTSPLQ